MPFCYECMEEKTYKEMEVIGVASCCKECWSKLNKRRMTK